MANRKEEAQKRINAKIEEMNNEPGIRCYYAVGEVVGFATKKEAEASVKISKLQPT